MHTNVDDSEILIDKYSIIRRDRIDSGGGAIVLYLKEHLIYNLRIALEMLNIETLFVELQFSNGNFLVGFVYRPPNNNLIHYSEWLNCMDILLEKCHNKNKRFILLGDFNIDLVSTVCQRNSWISTFQNTNLTQIIKEPTIVKH